MLTVGELSEELGVDPGDVRVLLAQLDAHNDHVSDEKASEVRDQLHHFGERTGPGIWWPGSDPDAGSGATKMR